MSARPATRARVLLTSYVFPPSVGGIERSSISLARMLVDAGHDVTVVTMSAGVWPGEAEERFAVVRRPTVRGLIALTRRSDAVVVNNPSLRLQWPALLLGVPHITVLHAFLEHDTVKHRLVRLLKLLVLRRSSSVVAVSAALARTLPARTLVIPNTYDAAVFRAPSAASRPPGSVVFVGRLIHQKGVDVLLDAVRLLRSGGSEVDVTVIGDGPERKRLAEQARALGLGDHARFTGSLGGAALSEVLAANLVAVVPSRGEEPFGITALEALGAGCSLVVTDTGGPPEAAGPCGLVVPPDDVPALAEAIRSLLDDPALRDRLLAHREEHLERHSPAVVGAEYDALVRAVLRR